MVTATVPVHHTGTDLELYNQVVNQLEQYAGVFPVTCDGNHADEPLPMPLTEAGGEVATRRVPTGHELYISDANWVQMRRGLEAFIVEERARLQAAGANVVATPAQVAADLTRDEAALAAADRALNGFGVEGQAGYFRGSIETLAKTKAWLLSRAKVHRWRTQLEALSQRVQNGERFQNGTWISNGHRFSNRYQDSLLVQARALELALATVMTQATENSMASLREQLNEIRAEGASEDSPSLIEDGQDQILVYDRITYVIHQRNAPSYLQHQAEIDAAIVTLNELNNDASLGRINNNVLLMRRQAPTRIITQYLGLPGLIYTKTVQKAVCTTFFGVGFIALTEHVNQVNRDQTTHSNLTSVVARHKQLRDLQKKVAQAAAWGEFKYRWTLQTLISYYRHLRGENATGFHFCNRDYCRNLYFDTSINAATGHYTCPACEETRCVQCGASHPGRTCDEYRRSLNGDAEFQALLHDPNSDIRPCPYCLTATHRTEACYHMDCPNCDSEWNWEFGRPRERSYITTYGHAGEAGRAYRVLGDADYQPGRESAYPDAEGAVHRRRANHRGLHEGYSPTVNGGYISGGSFDAGVAGAHRPNQSRDVVRH